MIEQWLLTVDNCEQWLLTVDNREQWLLTVGNHKQIKLFIFVRVFRFKCILFIYSFCCCFSSREVITYLHSEKIPVFLISGGFKQLNVPLAHRLNIPSENVYSVELLFGSDGKELDSN